MDSLSLSFSSYYGLDVKLGIRHHHHKPSLPPETWFAFAPSQLPFISHCWCDPINFVTRLYLNNVLGILTPSFPILQVRVIKRSETSFSTCSLSRPDVPPRFPTCTSRDNYSLVSLLRCFQITCKESAPLFFTVRCRRVLQMASHKWLPLWLAITSDCSIHAFSTPSLSVSS